MLISSEGDSNMDVEFDIDHETPDSTEFVELMPLLRGTGEVMFESIKELLTRLGLDLQKLVAIATDGAPCMTKVHQGVVTRLRVLVPHLVGTHCIAHREALAAKDANDEFPCLGFIDRAANKVYEWLGRSVIRQSILEKLLLTFREETRVVFQIHSVRWLSRGMVMERLVFCMPVILKSWEVDEATWFGCEKVLILHYNSMPGYDRGGSLEECMSLGRQYVQKVIDSLNDRFHDLPIFNAAKLFRPKQYPVDELDRGTLTEQWLNWLTIHFRWSDDPIDR